MTRLALAALLAIPVPAAWAQTDPWRSELHALVESYREGRLDDVARQAAQLAARTADAGLRAEAAALQACALLRAPERAARVDGRSLLATAVRQQPALAERPDCLLALGVAAAGLNETSSALLHLSQAADGFRRAGQPALVAEANAELAHAWAIHGEWESTPPELGVLTPASPDSAAATRLAQVTRLRAATAGLGNPLAERRIDLALARLLVAGDAADAARGETLLSDLASAESMTPEAAEAALALAERREARGETGAALELYRRVADAQLGESSRAAAARAAALERPLVKLDAPDWLAPGGILAPRVSARGVKRVGVELRALDLGAWLAGQQGKLTPAALPDSGSLSASAAFETSLSRPFDEWRSGADEPELRWLPDPGAYVLLARGSDAAGRDLTDRRLVVVGDIRADLIVGRERGLIWATDAAGWPLKDASCEFWCFGSFAATKAPIANGVGLFRLPGEAVMFRDRRCVALVRSGEGIGLVTGELPVTAARSTGPAVALLTDALSPAPGDVLRVRGWLLPGGGDLAGLARQTLRLGVVDGADRAVMALEVKLTPLGTFATDVPIPASMASESFRLVLTADGREIPGVCGPVRFSVASRSPSEARVEFLLPSWVQTGQAVRGTVRAAYPWGTPVRRTDVALRLGVLQLPDPGSGMLGAMLPPLEFGGDLDAAGGWAFEIDPAQAGAAGRFAAIDLAARVRASDGRIVSGRSGCIVSPEPVQLVVTSRPRSPRAGDELRVWVRVLDLQGTARGDSPSLTVEGRPVALAPSEQAGEYVSAALVMPDGALTASAAIEYGDARRGEASATILPAGAADASNPPSRLSCAGVLDADTGDVRVELDRASPDPVLVLLDTGEPAAAAALASVPGALNLSLHPDAAPGPMQVVVARRGPRGLHWEAAGEVRPRASPAGLGVSFAPSPTSGVPLRVTVNAGTAAEPAAVLVRLVDLAGEGLEPWWDLFSPEPAAPPVRTSLTLASAPPDERATADSASPRLAPATARAMFEGRSRFLAAQAVAGAASFDLPIGRPGPHALHVVARLADGRVLSESRTLDAKPAVAAELHVAPLLTPGDRSVAVVALRNERAVPAEVQVAMHAEGGLVFERGGARAATVAPGDASLLDWTVEATRDGAARVTALVTTDGETRTLSAVCRVAGRVPTESGAAVGWLSGDGGREMLEPIASPGLLCRVQRSWPELLADAATLWLDAPVEGTLSHVAELLWARAALHALPRDQATPGDLLDSAAARPRGAQALVGVAAPATLRELATCRLLAAAQRTGGWGRWNEQTTDPAATAWALIALDDDYQAAGEADAVRRASDRLWTALREAPQAPSAAANSVTALLLAALAPEARHPRNGRTWSAAAQRLEPSAPALEPDALMALVFALHRAGESARAQHLLGAWSFDPLNRRIRGLRAAIDLLTSDESLTGLDATNELLRARVGGGWADYTAGAWALLALERSPATAAEASGTLLIYGSAHESPPTEFPVAPGAPRELMLPAGTRAVEWRGAGLLSLSAQAAQPTRGKLAVERTITVVAPDASGTRMDRTPFVEGQSLPGGAVLEVREQWHVEQALDFVEWVQPLPPALAPRVRSGLPVESPLSDVTLGCEQVQGVTARLVAGDCVHAYELVTIRPGVYAVPPPRMWSDGRAVAVSAPAWRVSVGR